MFDPKSLRENEQVHHFQYPESFWTRHEEFWSLSKTEQFRAAFPSARLIGSPGEVVATQQAEPDLPSDFMPFMIVFESSFPDYYGFQASNSAYLVGDLAVQVWSVHTFVHRWDSFGLFVDWVAHHCASSD